MTKNKILVVVAHPDDELLGVGGTLCKHSDSGDSISVLILANGEDARDQKADAPKRLAQAQRVSSHLGAALHLRNFPDNQFDTVPLLSIAKCIEEIAEQDMPTIVYTHHGHDLNIDHRRTYQAVITAFRPLPQSPLQRILTFETPSSTEWQVGSSNAFSPNCFSDISSYLEKKKQLLQIYADELRPFPHPRSLAGIDALARWRGAQSGMHAAEAFCLVRLIF